MALHPSRSFSLRSTLGLTAALTALLAAACDASSSDGSHDDADASASFNPDAGSQAAPDGTALAVDAAAPPSARDIELARMQAHLDSLYGQSDIVHRFTTAFGDDVDCVPFQKQPGYARVSSLDGIAPVIAAPFRFAQPSAEAGFGSGVDAGGHARSCPAGAVPIRRVKLAELARFATLEDFFRKAPAQAIPPNVGTDSFVHDHAVYQSQVANWGAQTTLNVWNPAVAPNTFSLSQLWVVRGTNADLQTVEAGWTADRIRKLDDAEARLFIYSTAGNYTNPNKTDCYDLTCKAFVQMADSRILIGGKFDKTSVFAGEQRELTLRWQFCPATECKAWEGWWLRYDGGATSEWVGFYPRAMFNAAGLYNQGSRLDFGGEVAYAPGPHPTTSMGSGQIPAAGFGRAAYQTNLLRITTEHSWATFDGLLVQSAEAPSCYDSGGLTAPARQQAQSFYFGGFGGACK
jgi:hypothetical protein